MFLSTLLRQFGSPKNVVLHTSNAAIKKILPHFKLLYYDNKVVLIIIYFVQKTLFA